MRSTVAVGDVKGLTAENMLMFSAAYRILDDNGLNVGNERTKRVGEIFRLFGVASLDRLPVGDDA